MHDHSSHSHHHGSGHVHFDTPEMAAYAELEAEVLMRMSIEAIDLVADHLVGNGSAVRRVLDIGSGPGVFTCMLAERFSSANVLAVDGSAEMLERATARATRLGLGDRVEVQRGELPAVLESLDLADVVWASLVLHHVGDEAAALRTIRGLLAPDGILALVEKAGPLRFVPGDRELAGSEIWSRLDSVWEDWFAEMRAGLPDAIPSADYPEMLAGAGFEVVVDQVLTLELTAPLDERARRFAGAQLRRTRAQLADHADPADLEVLDALLDDGGEGSVTADPGANLQASRHLYVARATS